MSFDGCHCLACNTIAEDERRLAREWILRMSLISFLAGVLFASTLYVLLHERLG